MDITSEFAIEGIRQADRIIEELESCMRDVRKKPSEMKGIFLDADDAQQILDLLKEERDDLANTNAIECIKTLGRKTSNFPEEYKRAIRDCLYVLKE